MYGHQIKGRTCFYGVDSNVSDDAVQLLRNKIWVDGEDALNPLQRPGNELSVITRKQCGIQTVFRAASEV